MTKEADPSGAARSALSIAAIIFSITAIASVAALFLTRNNEPANNCEPIANTQEVATEISLTEARRMFEDYIFYGRQEPELLFKQFFPDETIIETTDEAGTRRFETQVKYEDFMSAYDDYLAKDLQILGEPNINDRGDGMLTMSGLEPSVKANFRSILADFQQTGENEFVATTWTVILDADADGQSYQETEKYAMKFEPNGKGGFKFTQLEKQ